MEDIEIVTFDDKMDELYISTENLTYIDNKTVNWGKTSC